VTGSASRLPAIGAGQVPYAVNANGRLIVRLKSIRTAATSGSLPVAGRHLMNVVFVGIAEGDGEAGRPGFERSACGSSG
jgi:hypothetical protein